MANDNEKRRHPRLPREEILSVKLIAPPTEFSHQGETLYCSTVNVSANGMQIHVNHPLEIGQQLDIWIVLMDDLGTFHLIGEVAWLQDQPDPEEPGNWLAGVLLQEESEHLAAWRELFR
jgi:Tfp pilus assembly protein PilZ